MYILESVKCNPYIFCIVSCFHTKQRNKDVGHGVLKPLQTTFTINSICYAPLFNYFNTLMAFNFEIQICNRV